VQKDSQHRQNADMFGDMTALDDIDRALIAHLAANARAPVAKLAQKMGLARTTVQARLDRLERTGVIASYTLRLSEDATRGQIRATVLIHLTPAAQNPVLAQLRRMPVVQAAHTTSGRFDLAVSLRAASTGELDETLDRIGEIEGVQALETLVHLSTRIDRG
jgi:DNA-binding Lrp family transcriptional regulator